jgi:DNA polymerase III alpha subunit
MVDYMLNNFIIDYNCDKTWKLFAEGKTKGIFQLESNLGKSWSKKLAPINLEELSALIAIIRPGTLKAFVDGKSMTQHYVDRKHGREEVTYLHQALEEILKPTYGILVYQEQSMRIAQKIAGFNLQEADVLRKAIGKKNAALMNEVKKSFIEGASKVNLVTKDEAEQIFGWIEKSARYAFNKSHSVSYAACSYWSAYFKAHNTKDFFLSYLYHASEKQDPQQETYELISEAKLFDIQAKTPSLANYSDKFNFKNGKIYFGIKDIKCLTGKTGDKLIEAIKEVESELGKDITKCNWVEILLYLSPKVNSAAFKALASIGFFRDFADTITRNKALYDYDIYRVLTKSEQVWLHSNYQTRKWLTFVDCLKDLAPTKKEGGGTSKTDRKQVIENEIQLLINPPYDLQDDVSWVIDQEVKFLGCPVSMTRVETSDTSAANTTCKEVVNGKRGKDLCIVANVQRVSDYKITKGESKGQTMSFLTIEDDTCVLDSVIIFPKVKDKYKYVLYEGNNLIFCGSISEHDNSFIVNKIHEI